MNHTLIIAEAGVNHNGNLSMAMELIDAAANSGADYVKFQTFKADKIVSPQAKKAEYQKANMKEDSTDSQWDMLKKLELSPEAHLQLIAHCREKNIRFLSTAFDLESIDLLFSLGIDLFKVPSGEITNLPYLRKIGALKCKVILSTGMCVMEEIAMAIDALVESGTDRANISVLHCTTDYPTAMEDVNLNAMLQIREQLNVPVGYSDHTLGNEVPIAAVAMGATIIEKHFTLNRNLPGPDHLASLEPLELLAMVKAIRNIEKAIGGSGEKLPTPTEVKNKLVARKSIHLAASVTKGAKIKEQDLIALRPGDGISPMDWDKVIGKTANKEIPSGYKLNWEDLE